MATRPEKVVQAGGRTPPQPRKSRRPRDTATIIDSLRDNVVLLERALAGYHALGYSLQTHHGQLPEGDNGRGLPVFTFAATANGRDSVPVCVDLKKIAPEHVHYVLGPLIHAQGLQGLEALSVLEKDVQDMKALLHAALRDRVDEVDSQTPPDGEGDEEPAEQEGDDE